MNLLIVTFIYYLTLNKVMNIEQKTTMKKILGDVEIETIIKRMQGKKLKQTELNYLSRSIRPKLRAARLLTEEKILQKINKPDRSLDKKIEYNLSKYGYDMITLNKIKKQKKIPIPELISTIIIQRPKARFIEAIPVLLLKNNINKFDLIHVAIKNNIKSELGYLIETAMILAKKFDIKKDFRDLLEYLRNNKEKEIKYLGEEKDKEYMGFVSKASPKRIRGWNLIGRFFDEDFIRSAEGYII